MAPEISEIESSMSDWSIEELGAFFCCVRSSETTPVPGNREDLVRGSLTELFCAYSSKTTAQAKQSGDKLKEKIYASSPKECKQTFRDPGPRRNCTSTVPP